MHIPDGYLSPATCAATYGIMAPLWIYGAKNVTRRLNERRIPFLAIASAFTFVIMMFNIPIPGGTTGHAVGGALIAILLGPWAALLSVSLALLLQALLFGDGGITALAANCLAMGVIMPFSGYSLYRLIVSGNPSDKRKLTAAFLAGYLGINAAAFAVAFLLGIQPLIAVDAKGLPLYSPFPLQVTLPVMMGEHILLFGFVEALATVLILRYLLKLAPGLSLESQPHISKKLSLGILLLTLMAPLGIIFPNIFKAGGAWGEWGSDELAQIAGIVPAGLAKLEALWRAPLPDYGPPFGTPSNILWESFWYIACGMLGVLVVTGAVMSLKLLNRRADG